MKRWLQPIKLEIPEISSATCTTRNGKTYVTVKFTEGGSYNHVLAARHWLIRNGYPYTYITSGGTGGGTLRINGKL